GIVAVMAGAVYNVHLGNGFFMNWSGQQGGEGFEYHIIATAIALALVVLGGGWASMDGVIARRLTGRTIARELRPVESPAAGKRRIG
ncbi:MAG TPA: hypothetical protein VFX92_07670, partial [Candidatus Krumholzibacteria bacterium]|nr:hypothetical protein [Candidatus Krumholzibacteria bacterium]